MADSCSHGNCGDKHSQQDERDLRIKTALGNIKNKLLIMSGKGGVGKSTVAVNLAVTLAKKGKKVGLMDVDLHGPSIPGLLGLVDQKPGNDGTFIQPLKFSEYLHVISMGNFLPNKDDAVIWRGPLKITAIKQFLGDVFWGDLDYLLIDSPPGTGDEPLTVAQEIEGVRAVVITTPQEVSLADVRKSINFCKNVAMPVVGVIENMSGYACPKCGEVTDLFGRGGGQKTALEMNVPFLGDIPIDPRFVISGDTGKPFMLEDTVSPSSQAYGEIVEKIEQFADSIVAPKEQQKEVDFKPPETATEDGTVFAIPTAQGMLCQHFGHCELFELVTVKDNKIVNTTSVEPPPHEPGLLPRWLAEQGVKMVIAGGMGQRAQDFFNQYGVQVVVGAPVLKPEEVVTQYLEQTLQTGQNVCDH